MDLLWDTLNTLLGHALLSLSCGTLLSHSCGTLLSHTCEHPCRTLVGQTFRTSVGQSFRALVTLLCENLVNSCRSPAGHSGLTLVENSCRSLVGLSLFIIPLMYPCLYLRKSQYRMMAFHGVQPVVNRWERVHSPVRYCENPFLDHGEFVLHWCLWVEMNSYG